MSFKGMLMRSGIFPDGAGNIRIAGTMQSSNVSAQVAKTYYVDRNVNGGLVSGNGLTWETAFLTLAEAIAAVNADYTAAASNQSRGRMRRIIVSEGWYAELPVTLTASDVHIIGVAPGSHDSTVIYGVPVAGTFSGVAGGPTLTLNCSNCTIENMGFFCSDPLYASVSDGRHSGDPGGLGQLHSYNNKFINCSFIRDVDDGSLGGIDVVSNEGPYIIECRFSTSCKDFGVRIRTNGSTNPVGVHILGCEFVGCDKGILQNAGHQTIGAYNFFFDDTTDRPGVMSNPTDIVATSAYLFKNFAPNNTLAEFDLGGAGTQWANICSDSDETNWPADG